MADPPPSKPESEAVHLLYRRRFPDATGDPPHEVAMELLREVREHAAKIESAALDILRRETRNPPSRGYYSKQMQFFFVRVLPLVLLVAALTAVLMWCTKNASSEWCAHRVGMAAVLMIDGR